MDTKVTKKILKRHLSYEWFKYLLVVMIAIIGWYGVFSFINKYRGIEELTIFVGACGLINESSIKEDLLNELNPKGVEIVEMSNYFLTDVNFSISLLTAGIQNSDIFILDEDTMKGLVSQDAIVPLKNDDLSSLQLDVNSDYYIENDTIYGIEVYDASGGYNEKFKWINFSCLEEPKSFYLAINTNSDFNTDNHLSILLEAIQYLFS